MSAITPIPSGGLVTFTVKVDGCTIPDIIHISDITIENSVNAIPKALITILDGAAIKGDFEVSSSDTFVPGKRISIEAGYDTKNNSIFEGIITKQRLRIDESIGPTLVIECYDQAIKMTVGRKHKIYQHQKDSDIIQSIIGNYSGLNSNITSTAITYPKQVQYNTSDWDFMVSRAQANGMILTIKAGKISIAAPDADNSSVLLVEYGDNLMELNASLDAVDQFKKVKATAWDYTAQQTRSKETETLYKGPGNLSSKKLADVVNLSDYELQTSAPLNDEELATWSKAEMIKSNYAKIQGKLKIQGSHVVTPGRYITLAGLGSRFNGDHFVSQVNHHISDGNWLTEVSMGMSADWDIALSQSSIPSSTSPLSGMLGLSNATVKQIHEDPDSQYRVLIDIPSVDSSGIGIWARVSNLYATSGAGAFFMPEIGDEVIVGFLNDDARFPIILGSIYSVSKHKPSEQFQPNETNSMKGIVTKSGNRLTFNDDDKIIKLETPNKNCVTLDDTNEQITIEDQNANRIVLSPEGIHISSASNLSLKAKESLILSGGNVTIESSETLQMSGLSVSISADTEFSANAGASASLSAGGETSINGAMVMIN